MVLKPNRPPLTLNHKTTRCINREPRDGGKLSDEVPPNENGTKFKIHCHHFRFQY